MKWYKRDPNAAIAGMIGLTLEERAVYNTVIDLLYSRDGNVRSDADQLIAKACGCRQQMWRRIRDQLIAKGKLHYLSNGMITANRVEEELRAAEKIIKKTQDEPSPETPPKLPRNSTETPRKLPRNSPETPSKLPLNSLETPSKLHLESPLCSEKINEINGSSDTTTATATTFVEERENRGGGLRACAREPERPRLISQEADDLAEKIGAIAGIGPRVDWPPGWCQAPSTVQVMLSNGWHPEIMLAAATAAMKDKRDGPPWSVDYFKKSFARAHARFAQPLPVVNVNAEPEIINGTDRQPHQRSGGSYQGNGFGARVARLARKQAAAFGPGS